MDEYLSGDDGLPVCAGMTDDWDLEQLSGMQEDDDDDPSASFLLKSFKEAHKRARRRVFFLGALRFRERSHGIRSYYIHTQYKFSSLKQTDLRAKIGRLCSMVEEGTIN